MYIFPLWFGLATLFQSISFLGKTQVTYSALWAMKSYDCALFDLQISYFRLNFYWDVCSFPFFQLLCF